MGSDRLASAIPRSSEKLVECFGGPLNGQTFTEADWALRRLAHRRMRELGSKSISALDYKVRAGKAYFQGEWEQRTAESGYDDEIEEASHDASHRWD